MKISKLLLVVSLLLIFGSLFFPRPHVANDLHHLFQAGLRENFSLPQTTRDFYVGNGMGERYFIGLWGWPVQIVFAALGVLGIDFTYLMIFLGFLPMVVLAAVGIYKLLDEQRIGKWGRTVGTFFYLVNSYFLLLIDGGQVNLAICYALLPWAFLLVLRALAKPSLQNFLKALLPIWGISIFDPRILFILGILLLIKFLIDIFLGGMGTIGLIKYAGLGLFLALSLGLLHFYWLLPVWFTWGSAILPATYERASQVSFLSFVNMGHSLVLEAPHWYKNIFGQIAPLEARFFLIPILVFLAPILKRKDKNVAFWLVIAALGVFLTKGSNPPLGSVYTWVFSNIPGFSLFRDTTKFFFLTTISYSVLLGITIDEIEKRWGWNLKFNSHSASIVPVAVIIYLLLLSASVYTGKMTGLFSKPIYQKESFLLADKLAKDSNFGRILWIPTITPLGFASPTHPMLDASNLMNIRPFASAVAGTYETFNFLRTPYIYGLLDIAGIKYIVYPYPDTRRVTLKQDNIDYYHWFLGQLSNSSWGHIAAELGGKDSPIPVVEVNKYKDKFFLSQNAWWIIGSDRIYEDLAKLPNFDLSKNALIFAEERPGLAQRLKEFPNAKLLLYNKSDVDLAANFLDGNSLMFPARNLDFSPTKDSGWWKREAADLISWRGFLQEKYGIDNQDFDYGGGWAVAESNKQLTISNKQFAKDEILLVRAMQSNRGGKIDFYQGDKLIGTVDTLVKIPKEVLVGDKQYNGADFHWFEVGSFLPAGEAGKSDEPLTIKTSGDINVINALAALDIQDWNRANRQASVLVSQSRVFEWDKLTPALEKQLFEPAKNGSVSYDRLDATHYSVKVEGLKEPAVLTFSETYDPLWQANGKQPVELYSLINGFPVEKDGTYDIYFTPQKYVIPGLVVSGLELLSLVGLAFILKK